MGTPIGVAVLDVDDAGCPDGAAVSSTISMRSFASSAISNSKVRLAVVSQIVFELLDHCPFGFFFVASGDDDE